MKSPEIIFSLHYDRLYVDHKCYVWSDVQRKVVQYYPVCTTLNTETSHIVTKTLSHIVGC